MSGSSNPTVAQGVLQRLRASFVPSAFPFLAVTSPFLGKEGIQLSFRGDVTVQLDTMTGVVRSPEPYLGITVTLHLLKTQGFAEMWRAQMELNSLLGQATLRPDAATMTPYNFHECSILGIGDQAFNGSSYDYPIRIGGMYQVNAAQFNS